MTQKLNQLENKVDDLRQKLLLSERELANELIKSTKVDTGDSNDSDVPTTKRVGRPRKSSTKKRIQFLLSPEEEKQLMTLAEDEDLPVSHYVRRVIQRYVLR